MSSRAVGSLERGIEGKNKKKVGVAQENIEESFMMIQVTFFLVS